jgi:hypothetical protein
VCLIKQHARKTYGGKKVQLHAFLNVTTDGGGWSASRTAWERAIGTYWTGVFVGHRTGLHAVEERNIPNPCRESNLNFSAFQPFAIPHRFLPHRLFNDSVAAETTPCEL